MPDTKVLVADLPNGVKVQVQAATGDVGQNIAAAKVDYRFDTALQAIEGIASGFAGTLERVKPRNASVEFELDFSVESGQLTALFVKGSGSGTLKIKLEWGDA